MSVGNINNKYTYNYDILKLFNSMNNTSNNDNNKSFIFDVSSFTNAINLFYQGIANDYKVKHFDSKTNLKHILAIAPKSMKCRKSGVFLRKGYEFTKDYELQFDTNNVLDIVPTKNKDVERINKEVFEKFRNTWTLGDNVAFFDDVLDDIPLYIKDQSYFISDWKYQFKLEETSKEKFFSSYSNGKYDYLDLDMMHRDQCTLDTYDCEKLNCLMVSLPYNECNNHSMLIIMPNEPHSKKQLIQFCNEKLTKTDVIAKFYDNKYSIVYDEIYFPKFNLETKWLLSNRYTTFDSDKNDDNYILRQILNPKIPLTNISKDLIGFNYVDILSISNFINHEYGISVVGETDNTLVSDYAKDEPEILKINKSFIFMIMNKDCLISKIGMFVG